MTSKKEPTTCGGIFDYDTKKNSLSEVNRIIEDPAIWENPDEAQSLGKKKKTLENIVLNIDSLSNGVETATELLQLAIIENDDETLKAIREDIYPLENKIYDLEFQRMFSNELDPSNCFLDIQSGAGGTESQDWAEMLERMYLRYCEKKSFTVQILERSNGEVAGIKNSVVKISGDYAYGTLRTEIGIHRLVRKSPFDSNAKRHTSFASVFVYPEIDESITVDINPSDLRIDTYRASGAGGQHVNRTDSAVRITHMPTEIVVQCQNDRSQHKNKAEAMSMLRAKLYEFELRKQNEEKQTLEDNKSDIGWGHQIRSYVLDQSRIKDLRTNIETGNTQAVLDGDLEQFIMASLKKGL